MSIRVSALAGLLSLYALASVAHPADVAGLALVVGLVAVASLAFAKRQPVAVFVHAASYGTAAPLRDGVVPHAAPAACSTVNRR